jgi:conjugative transposon TraJ protein
MKTNCSKNSTVFKTDRMKTWMAFSGLIFFPAALQAQTGAADVAQLHTVLENVYSEMIPLCSQLIAVARGIAAFGATFYIGLRVWKHIANAEPIDFFPLFRPFVLAILIGIYPSVLALMNGILKPTVTATAAMVSNSNLAVSNLLAEREAAIKNTRQWQVLIGPSGEGDYNEWYKYTHPGEETGDQGFFNSIGTSLQFGLSKIEYNIRFYIKLWISSVLQIIYYAAALCIDTLRTFHLIVLAILGPLVFGLAVFDGFQHTLPVWIGRYINIYMWLPVANIFGAILGRIQENMIKVDLSQLQNNGDSFFTSTDAAYLIFLVIGIVGYFTVPSVANYIVHASGGSALLGKVNRIAGGASSLVAGSTVAAATGMGSMVMDAEGDDRLQHALADAKNSEGYLKDHVRDGYQSSKISG